MYCLLLLLCHFWLSNYANAQNCLQCDFKVNKRGILEIIPKGEKSNTRDISKNENSYNKVKNADKMSA